MYLILNYLSNRSHFAVIDSRCSNILYSKFDVPQGSVLRPVLFNLCVTDMKNCVPSCTWLQHPHDSTIYRNCQVKDIKSCTDILTSELLNKLIWSSSNNLAFHATKTKAILFTTRQMEKWHGFEQMQSNLNTRTKL